MEGGKGDSSYAFCCSGSINSWGSPPAPGDPCGWGDSFGDPFGDSFGDPIVDGLGDLAELSGDLRGNRALGDFVGFIAAYLEQS